MKDNDYTFGMTTVSCDNCSNSIDIDGFDGNPLPYSEVNKQLREEGWKIRNRGDDWFDFCPDDDCDL